MAEYSLTLLLFMKEGLRIGIERGVGPGTPVDLAFSAPIFLAYLLVAGLSLGLVASLAAVGRFLRL